MMNLWSEFVKEESGQGLVEYGLILALVSIVVIVALRAIGTTLNNKFKTVESELNATTP